MSEIRDYAGGYRTGDTVFWAGDELEVSAGMDDWTTVVCENEEPEGVKWAKHIVSGSA